MPLFTATLCPFSSLAPHEKRGVMWRRVAGGVSAQQAVLRGCFPLCFFSFSPCPAPGVVLPELKKKKKILKKKKRPSPPRHANQLRPPGKEALSEHKVCKQVATLVSQATPALARRAFKITLRRSELAMNFDFMARVADFCALLRKPFQSQRQTCKVKLRGC